MVYVIRNVPTGFHIPYRKDNMLVRDYVTTPRSKRKRVWGLRVVGVHCTQILRFENRFMMEKVTIVILSHHNPLLGLLVGEVEELQLDLSQIKIQ